MSNNSESIVSKLTVEDITEDGRSFSRAILEPLPRGDGHTIGNSLRRMMLSSLPGLAVVRVKITGAEHMYDTIPYVAEDVLDICNNLKRLKLAGYVGKSVGTHARIVKEGLGDVTAADIEGLPGTVSLPEKDYRICTLGKGAKLEMELFIEEGSGYESWEQRRERNPEESVEVGHLGLDATYSPVLRVAYSVEQTRHERRVDLDRLIVDIETDGTITAQTAIEKAAAMLVDRLYVLTGVEEREQQASEQSLLETSIDELAFGDQKIRVILTENKILTLGDLVTKSRKDLNAIDKIGKKSVESIEAALQEHKLTLAD